jgi:hypothetical protein
MDDGWVIRWHMKSANDIRYAGAVSATGEER